MFPVFIQFSEVGQNSTLTTTGSGVGVSQTYCAYGKKRSGTSCASGNSLATDRQFTGQKYDVTGLHYYNARYYDDHIGQFVSPDSIVPEPSSLIAWNRFAYAADNPLRYSDPSGHCVFDAGFGAGPSACGSGSIGVGMAYASQGMGTASIMILATASNLASQAAPVLQQADKLAGMDAWIQSNPNGGQSASNMSQAGNSASSGGDPNDPFHNATSAIRRGVDTLRAQINNVRNYTTGRYGAQAHLSRAEYYQQQGSLQSVNPTGSGSIDLILNGNAGVEVKYWSANYLANNVDSLARQLKGFSSLNLNQITLEFVQTQNNPVTTSMLTGLRDRLINEGVSMTNISLNVVANPGIP